MSKRWSQIGEQGVALVIAELLGRDIIPYRPVVDDHGVDLMLGDGKRLQVKAANLSLVWNRRGPSERKAYQFSLQKRGDMDTLRNDGVSYAYRDIAENADFLILVGIDEKRFWVIPSAAVNGCKHIGITQHFLEPKVGPRFRFWQAIRAGEGRWDLLTPKPVLPEVDIAALSDPRDDEIASFVGWMN